MSENGQSLKERDADWNARVRTTGLDVFQLDSEFQAILQDTPVALLVRRNERGDGRRLHKTCSNPYT